MVMVAQLNKFTKKKTELYTWNIKYVKYVSVKLNWNQKRHMPEWNKGSVTERGGQMTFHVYSITKESS